MQALHTDNLPAVWQINSGCLRGRKTVHEIVMMAAKYPLTWAQRPPI